MVGDLRALRLTQAWNLQWLAPLELLDGNLDFWIEAEPYPTTWAGQWTAYSGNAAKDTDTFALPHTYRVLMISFISLIFIPLSLALFA